VKFTSYKIWLNEKFTEEDTDPIKDMGISIRIFWKNENERIDKMSKEDVYEQYFREFTKNAAETEKSLFKEVLHFTLLLLTNKFNPKTAFHIACSQVHIVDRWNIHANQYRRIITKVLKKYFHVDVTKKITEQLIKN